MPFYGNKHRMSQAEHLRLKEGITSQLYVGLLQDQTCG
jgi:hypothetical protein